MQKEPGIKWLFLDLNSYFASVEQQDNPNLRGKPIAVVPVNGDHTCAIAVSYEAKLYGVKTGTVIRDAKRMCPNLICVPARHDIYVQYHHKIIEEIAKHTPINKIWSIDELSSRLPPQKRNIESATKIANTIRNGLWQNVGQHINCSIGIAPNSLLAKIASDMKKPNGLTIIIQESLPEFIHHLALTDLPGIGKNMQKRLHKANVNTIQDLWAIPAKQARRIWNSVEGERFWYMLHGYDIETPATNTVMFGHSRVLAPQFRSPEKAYLITKTLLHKACKRMRDHKFYAQKLYLSIRNSDDIKIIHECHMLAAQDTFTILQHMDKLWSEIMQQINKNQTLNSELKFKKTSVILHNLIKKEDITDDIFLQKNTTNTIRLQKNTSLTHALDLLRDKYQKDVVTIGQSPKTLSGYVGTKIAFSRVPDLKEF